MKYVGIDLGTTNSAIATYDGVEVSLFKSPEQQDVTPSAIYVDRRGNRFVGARAYSNAALDPDNAALLFKRQMGTSTQFDLPNLGRSLSAEACSTEVLKVLYGYLPDAVRNSEETATVITVPAAFDQMQKDATLSAALEAGIGQVALMQEPVAAVMSVMRKRRADGIFLIYDLGGGTLDIAIAQSISGRVNLLAHGGMAMCGGRDMDRFIVDSVVQPWLRDRFDLETDVSPGDQKRLFRLSAWAAEKAKIELSQRETTTISLSEAELNRRDAKGQDMYVDAVLDRSKFNSLIAEQLDRSIEAARETMRKAGLEAPDIERIVFVGGPTFYSPLRDRVAFELGIAASTEVNPMTAVAEGAAVFAESIDWATASRGRKTSRAQLASTPLAITFHYISRTPGETARVTADLAADASPGVEFQIDAMDTGWSSGRLPLRRGATADLPLAVRGENVFVAKLFDPAGGPMSLPDDRIVITRTAATIDGIPASQSIGLEVRDRLGGATMLDYLVREGDLLPKRGRNVYKAEHRLDPGETRSLKFKLWEGEIRDPVTDNHFIGMFAIHGSDLGDRPIPAGAELICEYEILDSGNIVLQVHVPAIEGSFNSGRNFYSRQEGQIDFGKAEDLIRGEAQSLSARLEQFAGRVPDQDLDPVRQRVAKAGAAARSDDPEVAKHASETLQEAKRLLAKARQKHLRAIREIELEQVSEFFNGGLRALARPSEVEAFDAAARAAEAALPKLDGRFEEILETMRGRAFVVLWRQDDFVIARFEYFVESPHLFSDETQYAQLNRLGRHAVDRRDIEGLRRILGEMEEIRIGGGDEVELAMSSNIVRAN